MGELTQELIDQFVIAAHSDLPKVKEMLAEQPQLLTANARWNETALGGASHMAERETVTYLLEQGAPLDIFAAIALDRIDDVAGFLQADPQLAQARGPHQIPILYYPAATGNVAIGKLLLAHGADVNAGAGGLTPLHGAAHFGQAEFARWLLDHGADVNAAGIKGQTALALAEKMERQSVIDLLRARGAAG